MIRFDPTSGLSCQMQLKRCHRHRVRFPDELYNDKIFSNFARIFFEDFLRFSLKKFKFFDKFSPPTNWKLISSKLNNQLHTILFIVPTFVGWQKTMKAAALDHATHSSINNKQIKIVLWWRSRTCCLLAEKRRQFDNIKWLVDGPNKWWECLGLMIVSVQFYQLLFTLDGALADKTRQSPSLLDNSMALKNCLLQSISDAEMFECLNEVREEVLWR